MMFAFYWIRITESNAIMSSKLHLKANEITTYIINNNVMESHWYTICLFKHINIQKIMLSQNGDFTGNSRNIIKLLLTLVLHLSTVNLARTTLTTFWPIMSKLNYKVDVNLKILNYETRGNLPGICSDLFDFRKFDDNDYFSLKIQ